MSAAQGREGQPTARSRLREHGLIQPSSAARPNTSTKKIQDETKQNNIARKACRSNNNKVPVTNEIQSLAAAARQEPGTTETQQLPAAGQASGSS